MEGASGVEFADLATAALVGVSAAVVAAILQRVAMRPFAGSAVDFEGMRTARVVGYEADDGGGARPGEATQPTERASEVVGERRGDRFDKFTDRARHVLTLAQDEAQRFNHNYIGTEHLLLALVRERNGVAARVLGSMRVELAKVREAVEFIIGRGDAPVVGEVGLTPRSKRVIELAIDEARRMGHHYIGTEHLLLGLVREGEGIAAGVLESLGVSLDRVRHEVIRLLAESTSRRPASRADPGFGGPAPDDGRTES